MNDKPFDCGTLFSPHRGKCFDINGEVFVCGEVVSPTSDGIMKGKIYSSNNFTETETETLRLDQTNISHAEPRRTSSAPSDLRNISLLNSLSDDCQNPGIVDKYKVIADAREEQKDSNPKWGTSILKHFRCSAALLQVMTQTKNSFCNTNSNMCPQCEEQTLVVNSKSFATILSLPPFCTTCKTYFVNEDDDPKDLETLRDALMGYDGPSQPSRGKIVMLSSKKESPFGVPKKHSVEKDSMSSTAHECQDDHLSRQIFISPSSGSVSEDITTSERIIQNIGPPEMVHPMTYDGYDEDSIITFQSELLSVYSEEEERLLHQDKELVHAIASKEITKYSAENHKMTSNCEHCSMPRMEINGIAKCVTCPKLLLKARQNAHTRRLCARERLVTMNFVPHGPQPSIAKRPMVFDFGFIPTNSTSDSDKGNNPVSINGWSALETNSNNPVSINGWSALETHPNNPVSVNGWSALEMNSFDDNNKLMQDSHGASRHCEISLFSAEQSLTASIEHKSSDAGKESVSNIDMVVIQSIEDDGLNGKNNGIKENDTEANKLNPVKLDEDTVIKEKYGGDIADGADTSSSLGITGDGCNEVIRRNRGPGITKEANERKEMAKVGHDPFKTSDEVSSGVSIGTIEETGNEKQGDNDLNRHKIGEYATRFRKNGNNDGVSDNVSKIIQMEGDKQKFTPSKDIDIDREKFEHNEKSEELLCEASRKYEQQIHEYANHSESPGNILRITSDLKSDELSVGEGSQDFATPRMNNLESGHTPLGMHEWEDNPNAHASENGALACGSDQLTRRNKNKEQMSQRNAGLIRVRKEESRLRELNTEVPDIIHPISTFSPSKYILNPGDPKTTLFIEGSANPDFSRGYPYARYRSEETPEGSIECLLQEHRCDLKDIASIFRRRDNSATSYYPSTAKRSIEKNHLDIPSAYSQSGSASYTFTPLTISNNHHVPNESESIAEASRVLADNKRHTSPPVVPPLKSINFDSLRNNELVKKIPFSPIAAAKREAREKRLLSDHTRSHFSSSGIIPPQQLNMTDVNTRRNFCFDDSMLGAVSCATSMPENISVPSLLSKSCNGILMTSATPSRQSGSQPSQIINNFTSNESSHGNMLDDGTNDNASNFYNDNSEESSETNSFAVDLFSMMEDYRKSQKTRDVNAKTSFRPIPMGDSDIMSDFHTISTSTTSTTASTLGSQDYTLGLRQIESVESRVDVERLSYLMHRLGQVAKEIEDLDETIEKEGKCADDQSLV